MEIADRLQEIRDFAERLVNVDLFQVCLNKAGAIFLVLREWAV